MYVLTNIVSSGKDYNADRQDEITDEEGQVICGFTVGQHSEPRRVEEVRYRGDDETYFRLLNVNCAIYPGEDRKEHIARWRRVMESIARDYAAGRSSK